MLIKYNVYKCTSTNLCYVFMTQCARMETINVTVKKNSINIYKCHNNNLYFFKKEKIPQSVNWEASNIHVGGGEHDTERVSLHRLELFVDSS